MNREIDRETVVALCVETLCNDEESDLKWGECLALAKTLLPVIQKHIDDYIGEDVV
jgi:hypothetical protein